MKYWPRKFLLLVGLILSLQFVFGQSKPVLLGVADAIVYDILLTETDKIIACVGDKIEIWNFNDPKLILSWSTSRLIDIDYDHSRVAGVSPSGDLYIWDTSSGHQLIQKKISEAPLISVLWIDSVWMVAGSDQGELFKVNGITGEVQKRIKSKGGITAMAKLDSLLLVGDSFGMLSAYNSDLVLTRTIKAHHGWIRGIKVSDDKKSIGTVGDDGMLKMRTADKDLTEYHKLRLGGWVTSLDMMQYLRYQNIATGQRNGKIQFSTNVADYTYDVHAIVNSVLIIKSKLPAFVVIVGTHGRGLQVISAKIMKGLIK